jgi:hypothetical protein
MIIYCRDTKENEGAQITLIPEDKIIEEYQPAQSILQKLSLKDNVNQTNLFVHDNYAYFVNNQKIQIYNLKTYKLTTINMKNVGEKNGFFFSKGDYVFLMYGDDIYMINPKKNYETIYHHIGEMTMSTPLLIGNKLFISTANGDISAYRLHIINDKLYCIHEGSTNHHLCTLGVVRNISSVFNIGSKIILGFDGKVISCDYMNPDLSILVIEPSVLSNHVTLYSQIISESKILYVTQTSMITVDLNQQTVNQNVRELDYVKYEQFKLPHNITKIIDVVESEKYLILWCVDRIMIYDKNDLKTPISNTEIAHNKRSHIKSISAHNNIVAILKNDGIIIYTEQGLKSIDKSAHRISVYTGNNNLYICLYSNDGNCEIISLDLKTLEESDETANK